MIIFSNIAVRSFPGRQVEPAPMRYVEMLRLGRNSRGHHFTYTSA